MRQRVGQTEPAGPVLAIDWNVNVGQVGVPREGLEQSEGKDGRATEDAAGGPPTQLGEEELAVDDLMGERGRGRVRGRVKTICDRCFSRCSSSSMDSAF